jgi:reactive intermediate/imine deaminase
VPECSERTECESAQKANWASVQIGRLNLKLQHTPLVLDENRRDADRRNVMTRLRTGILMIVWVAAGLTASAQDQRRYIAPRTTADATQPPFSGGVMVGNTLYLSGTIGLDENQRPPDTPEVEARKVLDNVQATLKQAGLTMDDLVSVQVFCSDVKHYATFNTIYRTYFTKEFPARAFVGSGTLLYGARFEVQGIAVKR